MVPEVLTACKCIAVLSLIANVVVVPMAMCSVFDMVDVEVQALAECGTVLMGEQLALLKICDVSCGSSDRTMKIPLSIFALHSPTFRSIHPM